MLCDDTEELTSSEPFSSRATKQALGLRGTDRWDNAIKELKNS